MTHGSGYTVGSLFSGIGGIDLAFSWAGFDVQWQVEIEPFCQAVLRKHAAQYWPNARIHDDVTKVTGRELGSVDVMVGGFPCQDVSTAGTRRGLTTDTRSGLWFEFARLIGELRPRAVLVENTAGLVTSGLDQVLFDLARIGYDAAWTNIPAAAVGASHLRERIWIVAYPNMHGLHRTTIKETSSHSQRNSPAYQQAGYAISNQIVTSGGISGELNQADQPILCRAVDGLSSGMDRLTPIARQGQVQFSHEAPRQLAEKTSNWKYQLKALGNAVVPQVVLPIAVAIREYLDEVTQ